MSQFDLKGRRVLITGGARGLGAGIAEALATAGASVAIADILEKEGKETADKIAKSGAKAIFVKHDVSNEGSWESAIATTIGSLGGLDCVVNNAGIEVTALITEIDPVEVRKMLEVNFIGVALGMKHAFRAMRPGGPAGKGGSVLNVSSVAGTIPFPSIAAYSGTKSAVDRMTRVAAAEAGKLGYGIRVNCIYPGLVATDMGIKLANDMVKLGLAPDAATAVKGVVDLTPLGRLGEVRDMADAAVFLVSDASRFITGIGLPVDGGMGM